MSESQESPEMIAYVGIAQTLQSWPLYRKFQYQAKLATMHPSGAFGERQVATMYLPEEIVLPCGECKNEQRWRCYGGEIFADHFSHKTYTCKNCGKEAIHYFIYWSEDKANGLFFKVGQYPPLETEPARELRLADQDLTLYKRALTNRSFSYGLGALSYLRRVVEDQMNSLLDLELEAMRATGVTPEIVGELEEMRQRGTFEEKAKKAAAKLPSHLRPGGSNPFDVIADFASCGLHSLSEDECLDTFDRVRFVFEYLFRHLGSIGREAKDYTEHLSRLSGSKPS